jgi:hypothetical protein
VRELTSARAQHAAAQLPTRRSTRSSRPGRPRSAGTSPPRWPPRPTTRPNRSAPRSRPPRPHSLAEQRQPTASTAPTAAAALGGRCASWSWC